MYVDNKNVSSIMGEKNHYKDIDMKVYIIKYRLFVEDNETKKKDMNKRDYQGFTAAILARNTDEAQQYISMRYGSRLMEINECYDTGHIVHAISYPLLRALLSINVNKLEENEKAYILQKSKELEQKEEQHLFTFLP